MPKLALLHPDEGDNFLIELALAGNSRIIVTNNVKELTVAELKFDNLRIFEDLLAERGITFTNVVAGAGSQQ